MESRSKRTATNAVSTVDAGQSRGQESGSVTLASTLAARIREAILNGALPPGGKLRLDDLRASYRVSLSPLREALSRLGAEGLVIMEDQRGYRVAPVSEENLREVTRLRVELESMALQESIRKGDDAWEAAIVASSHRLGLLEARSPKRERLPEWELRHREFHLALLSACGMPVLLQFCQTLYDFGDRYRRVFLAQNPLDRHVHNEHQEIMQAAVTRKPRKAADLLRQHVERTSANVLTALARAQER